MERFRECATLTAISVIQVAIEICSHPELKREILCASGSHYDMKKGSHQYGRKTRWNKIVENEAGKLVENIDLPKHLKENVMGFILSVGMRMLTFAKYHEDILGFSREFTINFLNSSLFTQHGIINNKKAAEALMRDKNLSIEQKYKLACLYCFTDHIPALYSQMTEKGKEKFYNTSPRQIDQPGLVKFWSYYLIGEVSKIKGEKTLDQYRLEKAVESGCRAAVEYCLQETKLKRKKDTVIDAAVETVRNMITVMDDWVVFQDQQYGDIEESFIPNNYYTDILYFLLLKMKDDDKIEFFRKNIEDIVSEEVCFDHIGYIVLECFLNWPYQDFFMKSAELMWEFLAAYEYSVLLLKICNKIESMNGKNIKYGWEEKSYDYRGLLMEFWCKSAEHYKRYVFSEEIACTLFLSKLLSLKKFTNEDGRNIGIILASAADEEKEDAIAFKILRNIYLVLIKEEKWEILDWFTSNCFSSNEQASKFKRKLIFTKEAQRACHYFVKNGKWSAAESFINWVSLSEQDLEKLKKRMIYSEDGRKACLGLIQHCKSVENVESFIRWHFSFEEEIKAFKKELIFTDVAAYKCANLVKEDILDHLNEFIHLFLSSDKEIRELKKNIAYKAGVLVLEKLISDYSIKENYDEQGMICHTIVFQGGKWEEVEQFLTWCFLSEEEINEFKKNVLLEMSGMKIHFNLIKSNRWREAETFFAWLGLSSEEIIKLKKETLFDYVEASDMFSELMYSEEDDNTFVPYGGCKQDAIELLLRWYLTDKETILEFKDKFKHQHHRDATEKCEAVFENFDFAIAQCLQDLNKEKTEVKRKSETFSPNKRICNFNLDNTEEEYGK